MTSCWRVPLLYRVSRMFVVEREQEINKDTCSENTILWRISARRAKLNFLKPSGYYTYHQVQHSEILHSAHNLFTCL